MITKLYIAKDKFEELPVYNRVEYDERLDQTLDSGSVQTITDSAEPFPDYMLFKLSTYDNYGAMIENNFFGFDTVEKRGNGYYIHPLELVEPTRIVMGIPIDGCKITQPVEGKKKTLYDAVFGKSGLLAKAKLKSVSSPTWTFMEWGSEAISKMEDVISPEFHWESGTILWECLCDVGNVINCIPRIRVQGVNINRLYIDFVPVNDITDVLEM